jgi:hypothetical protein
MIASTEASHKKLFQLAEKTVLNPRDPEPIRCSPYH